jgi:hypothetical protein
VAGDAALEAAVDRLSRKRVHDRRAHRAPEASRESRVLHAAKAGERGREDHHVGDHGWITGGRTSQTPTARRAVTQTAVHTPLATHFAFFFSELMYVLLV